MLGCTTRRVISMGVLYEICSTCRINSKKEIEPPPHPYPINHTGSGGGMEAKLRCELVEEVFDEFGGTVVVI